MHLDEVTSILTGSTPADWNHEFDPTFPTYQVDVSPLTALVSPPEPDRRDTGRLVRVTTDLPEDEHRNFEIAAMDHDTSMGELLRAAAAAIAAGDADDLLGRYVR